MSDFVLETNGLSKSFPGTQALEGVEFKVRKGEVHGLIGENGAWGHHDVEDYGVKGLRQPKKGFIGELHPVDLVLP